MHKDTNELKPWQLILGLLCFLTLTTFGFVYFCYYLYQLLYGLFSGVDGGG
jgi:hypothetical protein